MAAKDPEKYFEEGLNESEDARKTWISFLAHLVNKNCSDQRLDKQPTARSDSENLSSRIFVGLCKVGVL